ncbi:hypothetical protein [Pontibacter diazotrophicus]|nr:hypothetical protein [Pontibacter diazotrophicus]
MPARSEGVSSLWVERLVFDAVLSDSEAAGAERRQLQMHSAMPEDEASRP